MRQEPVPQVVPATGASVRSGAGASPVAISHPPGDRGGPGPGLTPRRTGPAAPVSPPCRQGGNVHLQTGSGHKPSTAFPSTRQSREKQSGSTTAAPGQAQPRPQRRLRLPYHATPRSTRPSGPVETWHPSPVEVLEGVGELQATENDEGLQDLLQPLQRPCAACSPVELLDLPIEVAGKLLTHLQRDRAGCGGGSPSGRRAGLGECPWEGAAGKPWGSRAGAKGAQAPA